MMSKRRVVFPILSLITVTILFASALHAKPPENKGNPAKVDKEKQAGKEGFHIDVGLSATVIAGITIGEAQELAARYELTGNKPLPPGIRKNLARGKPMPPGIQKTLLADSFVDHLPHHKGHEWRVAGTDLVLVVSGSMEIAVVLEGVFD